MQAVAFASLFLGLVLGVQPVELVVGDGVARVELLLDGEPVGERTAAPWVIPVDLGQSLSPHRLEAIARDGEGAELGRAVQWLNLPRAQAEATVVLSGGEGGRGVVAHVAWESVVRQEPRNVQATFDGRPLPVADPGRIPLPDHDPAQLHLLRVEIEFSANLGAVAELVFGGGYGNQTATALTAVPVTVEEGRGELTVAALEGRLFAGDTRLRPVAVEASQAEVVLVMDRRAQAPLVSRARRWAARHARRGIGGGPSFGSLALLRNDMRLGEGQVARFLWPFSRAGDHAEVRYALFPRSEDHPPADGGLLWLMTAAQQPAFSVEEQRLADAVVAGMTAAGHGRRRAVILLLSEEPRDASQFAPETVRRYLSRLGVPLFVWSVGKVPPEVEEAWGEVRSVLRESWFRSAVQEVSGALERQRIVWVEGLHLPQEITLSGDVEGVRLVR